MMCFFLVMWLINAANEQTKAAVASYFNPVKLIDRNSSRKGLEDIGDGPNAIGDETEKPQTLDATTRAEGQGKGGAEADSQLAGCQGGEEIFRRASVRRSLRRACRDRRQHRRRSEHLAQGRRRRADVRPGDRRIRRRILPRSVRAGFLDQAGRGAGRDRGKPADGDRRKPDDGDPQERGQGRRAEAVEPPSKSRGAKQGGCRQDGGRCAKSPPKWRVRPSEAARTGNCAGRETKPLGELFRPRRHAQSRTATDAPQAGKA